MKYSVALLCSCILSSTAFAQSAAPDDDADASQSRAAAHDPVHGDDRRTIVVTGSYAGLSDLIAGTSVVTDTDIVRNLAPQIGDILVREPGVSATSFSPGASRPVLRGFQGDRVLVLTDGIGTLDVSSTSADHGVAIDPLTAQSIEIFRGPASLLFGSQAIGGAVNVFDRRIPRALPENGVHLDAIAGYASANDERSAGGAFDVALSDQFVFHVDGSIRRSNDLEVGGYVLSPTLRAEQLEIAAEEAEEGHDEEAAEASEFAQLRDRIPNTYVDTETAGAGFALINDGGSLGASFGYFNSDYGVPSRPGAEHAHGEEGDHDPDEEEGPVTIGMRQYRADLRGEITPDSNWIDALRLRVGWSDYEHTEFEGDEVGTRFLAQGVEGRFEIDQAPRGGWQGVTGLQYSYRDFEAIGAEAFVPANETNRFGVFTLQSYTAGDITLDGSARFERISIDAKDVTAELDEGGAPRDIKKNFNALSAAAGIGYAIAPLAKIGINVSRAERAPSAEELFSNGPHIATQAFELGSPSLGKETSWGLEGYLRGKLDQSDIQLAIWHSWFDDFIYEAATGEEEDGLPVYVYSQADADYWGVEFSVDHPLYDNGQMALIAHGVADYVHATIDGFGPAPRIPPFRVRGGLEVDGGVWGALVEAEYNGEQDRTGPNETPTDDFTLVNASVSWRPLGEDSEAILILSADNIFDVNARRHASFTKDFVPLSGRNLKISARLDF